MEVWCATLSVHVAYPSSSSIHIPHHGRKSFKGVGYSFTLPFLAAIVLNLTPGKIFGNKEMRLLMLGLDAAGKTSMSPSVACIPGRVQLSDHPRTTCSNPLQTQA